MTTRNRIEQYLKRTRNPFEIHQATGARLSDIRRVMKEAPSDLPGWGKPSLHPHIISRRHVQSPKWPADHALILVEHKQLHDQGRVSMCQGRDGDYIIQYAIPHKGQRPIKRQRYFLGDSSC